MKQDMCVDILLQIKIVLPSICTTFDHHFRQFITDDVQGYQVAFFVK